jgi:predicted  nucleic acid-binding Zn-ribbon protein
MSFEERAELLRQSIALRDRQLAKLRECIDKTASNLARHGSNLNSRIDHLTARIDQYVAATQSNFDRLTTALERLN